METIELGPCPFDETSAQVGTPDYESRAVAECNAFRDECIRLLDAEGVRTPDGCRLSVRSFDHEAGRYYELVAVFPRTDEGWEWGLWLDSNVPDRWSQEALRALGRL